MQWPFYQDCVFMQILATSIIIHGNTYNQMSNAGHDMPLVCILCRKCSILVKNDFLWSTKIWSQIKIICGVAHLDTWTILAFAQHTSNANFLASTPKTSNFSCIFETEGNKKYCGTKEFLLDGDFTQNKSSSRLFFLPQNWN